MQNQKLRVWNQFDSQMYYLDLIDLLKGRAPLFLSTDMVGPMLCSGLKDMNGNDIYDGDILKLINKDGEKIYVKCTYGTARRKMGTGYVCDIKSFYFETFDGFPTFPIVDNYDHKHDLDIMEIIGNIYENQKITQTNAV